MNFLSVTRIFLLAAMAMLAAVGSGCSHLPLTAPLPAGVTVTRLSDHQTGAPFAVSPDDRLLARVNDGLRLADTTTGGDRLVRGENPAALAWSPDGNRLAAAFPDTRGTVLAIYTPTGGLLAETRINAPLTSIAWLNNQEVAAGGLVLTTFKFGTNAATVLYRWDGNGTPTATNLKETTLRPGTARANEQELARGGKIVFSPLGDEVVFLHPHDPPVFTPHYKIIHRNLASGTDREVAVINLMPAAAIFAADGESVIFGARTTVWLDPWSDQQLRTIETPGKDLAVSPGGTYWFMDGTLYRDGTQLFTAPGALASRFGADGKTLYLAHDGAIYRLSGLQDRPVPNLAPETASRLRQLRAWRAEGLITPNDYRPAKERILAQ